MLIQKKKKITIENGEHNITEPNRTDQQRLEHIRERERKRKLKKKSIDFKWNKPNKKMNELNKCEF